jgi:HSP20 family protein
VVSLTFDPFRELDRLTGQLMGAAATRPGPRWMPMDLYRVDDHYVVTVDLPGVDPGSIDVNVDGNTLTLRAERTVPALESAQWLAQERPSGSFLRQLSLGSGLDVEKIQAGYEAGVLTLTIPVAEQAKPRKIAVETASTRRQVQGEEATPQGQLSG